jgi:NADPH-dependent F420 reductase
VRGKTVIDATVPLDPKNVRQLARRSEMSAAEEAQHILGPTTHVVAAFQNISSEVLADLSSPVDCDVLVCGDDRAAKANVVALIHRIGLRAVDAGPLKTARIVEELTPLLISINRRYHSKRAGIRITGIMPPG